MEWELPIQHYDWFLEGIKNSLLLTAQSLIVGMMIAIPVGLYRARRNDGLARFLGGYIYIFRGTPLLVQTYLIYYGLAQFEFIQKTMIWYVLQSAWWCCLVAFSLNTGAYTAEIVRVAVNGTPKGEVEAARAYGFSEGQIIRRIVLPSSFRRMLPHYTNEVVLMLHSSVVASVITIQDILGAGRRLNSKYYVAYEGFITAALIYLVLTFSLVGMFKLLERRYMAHLVR